MGAVGAVHCLLGRCGMLSYGELVLFGIVRTGWNLLELDRKILLKKIVLLLSYCETTQRNREWSQSGLSTIEYGTVNDVYITWLTSACSLYLWYLPETKNNQGNRQWSFLFYEFP